MTPKVHLSRKHPNTKPKIMLRVALTEVQAKNYAVILQSAVWISFLLDSGFILDQISSYRPVFYSQLQRQSVINSLWLRFMPLTAFSMATATKILYFLEPSAMPNWQTWFLWNLTKFINIEHYHLKKILKWEIEDIHSQNQWLLTLRNSIIIITHHQNL